MNDALTIRILTNTYQAVEKLRAWSFFDTEPPANKGYMFWGHPTLNLIGHALASDGHSGASMVFCMRWMQQIRKAGWNTVVSNALAENATGLGMLPLMLWKINHAYAATNQLCKI